MSDIIIRHGDGLLAGKDIALERSGDDVLIECMAERWLVARIDGNAYPGSGCGGSGDDVEAIRGVPHAWTEMKPATDGCGYVEMENGRSGTVYTNPAYELNGKYVAVGSLVFLRERGTTRLDTGIVYDFTAPPGQEDEDGSGSGSGTPDSYIDVVIEVCLVSEGSGSGSGGEVVVTP